MANVTGTPGNDFLGNPSVLDPAFPGIPAVNTTNDADVVFGLDGDDDIEALGGNDTIDAGTGNDIVDAGEGSDIIIGGQSTSILSPDFVPNSTVDFIFGGEDAEDDDIDTLTYEGTGIAVILDSTGLIQKFFTNNSGTFSVGIDQLVGAGGFGVMPPSPLAIAPSIEVIVGDSTQTNTISGIIPPGIMGGNGAFEIDLSAETGDNLTVNFVSGVFDGDSQSFRVENFSNVIGTQNSDRVLGGDEDNVFFGSEGNDELDGGQGNNTLDYNLLGAGINIGSFSTVQVDIGTPTEPELITVDGALVSKGEGTLGTDAIANFQTIIGDVGANIVNTIDGSLNEILGNSYNVDLSQELLTVNVSGNDRTFKVVNFTDVIGTVNDDVIVGSDADNRFGGSLGNDIFDGGEGFDTVDYSAVKDNENVPVILKAGGFVQFGRFTSAIRNIEEVIGSAASTTDLIDAATEEPSQAFIDVNLGAGFLNVNFIDPFIPVPGGQLSFEIANFENVRGTDNSDRIVGSDANNIFFGSEGFDVYDGGDESDNTLDYNTFGLGGAIALGGSGLVDKGVFGSDLLLGTDEMGMLRPTIQTIIADSNFTSTNTIDGELDSDGNARFEVNLATGGLNVELIAGAFAGQTLNFDIQNFGRVVGTVNDDEIIGNSDNNIIIGSSGNDIIDGEDGIDVVDYSELGAEITLQAVGQILKEGLGTDLINNIDTIIADDSFRNSINGVEDGAFFDAGNNASFDIALFENRLTLNPENAAPFPSTTFEVVNFTDVVGTGEDDSILGDAQDNILSGSAGDDVVSGRKGKDVLDGGEGNDQLNGGKSNDQLLGSTGDDLLDGGKGAKNSADYREFDGAITLGQVGIVEKTDRAGNSLGTDILRRIENIRANDSFTNTIDGSLGDLGQAAIFVNLDANELIVETTIPGVGPFEFRVFDFDNVVGTRNSDIIIGDANDNVFTGSISNDLLDGNGGDDTADYSDINTDIILNAIGFVQKEGLGTDLLVQIDNIIADADQTNTIDGSGADIAQLGVDLSQDQLDVVLFTPDLGPLSFDVQNFQNVVGSASSDFITGSVLDNTFFGSAGNDTYDGFSQWGNTVDYSALDTSITLLAEGLIEKEGLGTDTIDNINTIIGSETQTNTIDGQVNGGNAFFNVDLSQNDLEVVINGAGFVLPLDFKVFNFDNVVGTELSDNIKGNNNNNFFGGSEGNDVINGDDGFDTIDYTGLGAGITLASGGFVRKGLFGGLGEDSISNINAIIGDATQTNTIDAETDAPAGASVDVDLAAQTLTVNFVPALGLVSIPLRVTNFNNVFGSDNDDTIRGDSTANVLAGDGGNDNIFGANGDDVITGGTGDDNLNGQRGEDNLKGGNGNDSLDGGSGKDTIDGVGDDFGANDFDQLIGGANKDTFVLGTATRVYYQGIGEARILDFETGIDTIVLNGELGDYTIEDNNTILKDGDLIATTIGNFNTATDFDFV